MKTTEVICLNCEKTFLKNDQEIKKSPNHFCSRSCSAVYNNKKFQKRLLEGECKKCGKPCAGSSAYCSNTCYKQSRLENTNNRFVKGEISSPVTIKNHLKKYYNQECCSVCDQNTIWNNKSLTLQLDHIDGNSDNNLPENLRLLCPNCHTQTETFTSKLKKDTKRNRYLREFKGYGPPKEI